MTVLFTWRSRLILCGVCGALLFGSVRADDATKPAAPTAKEAAAKEVSGAKGAAPATETKPADAPATTDAPAGKARPAAGKNRDGGKAKELDPQRETQALEFARQHHPELVELLEQLRSTNKRQYAQAIQELDRTQDRLVMMQSKQPARHDMELSAWKVASRIRLLTAQLTMKPDAEREQALRALIAQQVELKVQGLIWDREQLANRIKALDAEIQEAQASRDQQVQAGVDKALSSATKLRTQRDRDAAKSKNKNKPKTNSDNANSDTKAQERKSP